MVDKDESEELPLEAEPAGEDMSSADAPSDAPAPRTQKSSAAKGGRREHATGASSAGFFGRTGHFLRDVRAEMKRVSWPTAREVKNTTIITLVAVIFFAVYLWGVDQAIVQLGHFGGWLLSLIGLA